MKIGKIMFLNKLQFNSSLKFKQSRLSQGSLFKIKEKKEVYEDKRNPQYDDSKNRWDRNYVTYPKIERTVKEFTIFRKNTIIDFKTLTVIVGENGCGKTTLLHNIKPPKIDTTFYRLANYESEEEYIRATYKEWVNDENRKLYFTSSPSNIIYLDKVHKESFIKNFKDNDLQGVGLTAQNANILFNMYESSNGENNLDFLNSLKGLENFLIILDEPETSLSIKSQKHIASLLKELSFKNQVIVVTHSPYLMRITDNVLCMESRKYINTEKYIKKQEN